MAKKEGGTTQDGTNVDVTPDKPLYITDNYRNFDTVTVYLGGQIFVQTAAQVTINHLIKTT